MPTAGSTLGLATVVLIAVAFLVIYLRAKNRLESNLPVLFFTATIAYANAVEGTLEPWMGYLGLALALFLRFEFLNRTMTTLIKVVEYGVVGILIYGYLVNLALW